MVCITISRQLGSLGCDVAYRVGKTLGFRVVWRELINQAALRAGAPEVALATIDELGLLGIQPSKEAKAAYKLAVDQVMHELADTGNSIILGRAGQVILRGREGVLHVRLIAPEGLRAQRIAERQGVPLEAALQQVKTSDQSRRNYLHSYYQVRWDDPELYDLIINTGRINPAAAADLIAGAAEGLTAPFSANNDVDEHCE